MTSLSFANTLTETGGHLKVVSQTLLKHQKCTSSFFGGLNIHTCDHPEEKWLLGWIATSTRNIPMLFYLIYLYRRNLWWEFVSGLSDSSFPHLANLYIFLDLVQFASKTIFTSFGRMIFSSWSRHKKNQEHGKVFSSSKKNHKPSNNFIIIRKTFGGHLQMSLQLNFIIKNRLFLILAGF